MFCIFSGSAFQPWELGVFEDGQWLQSSYKKTYGIQSILVLEL